MRRTRAKLEKTSDSAAEADPIKAQEKIASRIIVGGSMPKEWRDQFAKRLAQDVLKRIGEGK
jgi:hypothetical protein